MAFSYWKVFGGQSGAIKNMLMAACDLAVGPQDLGLAWQLPADSSRRTGTTERIRMSCLNASVNEKCGTPLRTRESLCPQQQKPHTHTHTHTHTPEYLEVKWRPSLLLWPWKASQPLERILYLAWWFYSRPMTLKKSVCFMCGWERGHMCMCLPTKAVRRGLTRNSF